MTCSMMVGWCRYLAICLAKNWAPVFDMASWDCRGASWADQLVELG